MSDESTPVNMGMPQENSHDGTAEAYESHDAQSSLEGAFTERAEAEEVREKIQELEGGEESAEAGQVEESQENDFSSKFAALSRKEKQLRERESQMQQKYESKLAELEERLSSLQQPQEPVVEAEPELPLEYRLKKDPLSTLAELGLDYEKLTNLALNDGKLTPEMQMDLMRQEIDQKYSKELEDLRNELVERDKRLEEERYNEVVDNFKHELTNFVNTSEKYELIRANDAVDVVYDVIEEHYNETGHIMSKDEAADQVESYLEQEVEKLLKLNKLKAKLGAQEAAQPAQPAQRQPAKKAPTLSNAHSAAASKPSRPRTRDESIAAATSLLKWND